MGALASLTSMAAAARSIGPAFEMAGQAIKNTITEVWNWFKSTFLDPVLNGAQEIGEALALSFKALTDPIGFTRDLMAGMFKPAINEAQILEGAVRKAFDKEWDQMLDLEEKPDWMTPDLWQKLQEEASVMAAQDWDGMLDLDKPKPDWMTNELWEELGKKGRDAAEQEWYSYFDPDMVKPDWMDEASWVELQKLSAGMADQTWEDFLKLNKKPPWMTDELWETLSAKIATEGKAGAEKLNADWQDLIVESDEPEWTKDEFWKNVSGEIEDQIDLAFEHIKRKGSTLAQELIGFFTEPFEMLTTMGGGGGGGLPGFGSGGGVIGSVVGGVTSLFNDAVMGPVGYSRVLSGPEGTFAFNDKDTIVAGTNLGGGGSTFNINVNASGITDRTDKRQLAREIGNMIQQEMSRSIGGTTMRGRYG